MKSLAELEEIRQRVKANINIRESDGDNTRIVVGMATCGIAAGARPVLSSLVEEVAKRNLKNVSVTQTGCIGVCQFEPVIEVYQPGKEKVTYVKMTPEKVVRVINDHIVNGNIVSEFTIGSVTN
jgi:NADP-reducing hydrogenase subunit HndB